MDDTHLAALVRSRRAYEDCTRRQVAETTGISSGTLGRIERGEQPSRLVAVALAKWLGPPLNADDVLRLAKRKRVPLQPTKEP